MHASYKLASILLAGLAAYFPFQLAGGAQSTRSAIPGAAVECPPILGIAHIGLFTNDMQAAHKFYGHGLGFADFNLDKPAGGLMLTYFKVNDHQYIEIFPDLKSETQDRLSHIAFETTDARQLRDYLASRGVKVPNTLKPGLDGNLSFMIKDPDGHNVEFVEYMPGSQHSRNFGKLLPDSRKPRRNRARGNSRDLLDLRRAQSFQVQRHDLPLSSW